MQKYPVGIELTYNATFGGTLTGQILYQQTRDLIKEIQSCQEKEKSD